MVPAPSTTFSVTALPYNAGVPRQHEPRGRRKGMEAMTTRSITRGVLTLTAAICLVAAPDARGQQQGPNQPGTKWTEEQLRQAVELARVGRRLTPKKWPNDSRVAVCLSFDTDTQGPVPPARTTSPAS